MEREITGCVDMPDSGVAQDLLSCQPRYLLMERECLTLLVDLTTLSIGALRIATVSGVHLASWVGLCSIYLLL